MEFESHLLLRDAVFWAVMAAAGVGSLVASRRALGRGAGAPAAAAPVVLVVALGVASGFVLATAGPGHPAFTVLRYLAFTGLAALPALAVGHAFLARRALPRLAAAWAALGLTSAAVGLEALVLGPSRVERVEHVVEAPARARLSSPLRIAHVSDIQTDRVGPREELWLGRVAAERPDLVVITGDFLQCPDPARYREQSERLRPLLAALAASARYGAFAVWGNVDPRDGFPDLLRGTGLELLEDESRVLDAGGVPLRLTGLSLAHGFAMDAAVLRPFLPPAPEGGLHLAFAHAPDFAAAATELGTVDLALAGHTHGGQVVVPGFGPPLTLSRLPRRHASGLSFLGALPLVVSKGLGMERSTAPRIRFFCPSDVTLVSWGPPAGRGSVTAPGRAQDRGDGRTGKM
ncbi:metallophosphoesterase [Myxococcota bacterium]|nr:metallophosphoesterase [Myxococcota bacterium]